MIVMNVLTKNSIFMEDWGREGGGGMANFDLIPVLFTLYAPQIKTDRDIITQCITHNKICVMCAYRQLNVRRALSISIFKDVLLRTRRVLSLYNVYGDSAPSGSQQNIFEYG